MKPNMCIGAQEGIHDSGCQLKSKAVWYIAVGALVASPNPCLS